MSDTPLARYPFLDGLRGWGALAVVLWHCFVEVFPYSRGSAEFLAFLPPINGFVAVYLFFAISGFSLSIAYINHGDKSRLGRLAVSRYPRLALPILAACTFVQLAMIAGAIPPPGLRPTPLNLRLLFEPTILHLLQFSLFDVFFRFSQDQAYIGPLWTMQFELLGSALVFGLLAILERHRYRGWIYGAFFVGLALDNSIYCLFVAGLLVAELHASVWISRAGSRIVLWAIFILACFMPLLTNNQPSEMYFAATAGAFAAVAWLAPLRRLFECRISRLLGRISFPLYLVHGPLLFSFALWVKSAVSRGNWDLGITHLMVDAATVPFAIVVAILFTPINDCSVVLSRRFGSWVVERVGNRFSAEDGNPRTASIADQPPRYSAPPKR